MPITTDEQIRSHGDGRPGRTIRLFMFCQAASLIVAALIHFGVLMSTRTPARPRA